MENPHPLGQGGPNPHPRNRSPASQSVAVCMRTMLRILMNSASTRVTPSKSSKKVMLKIIFWEMTGVNQLTCNQNRSCHSLECCYACSRHLYYGCVMMNISRYSNCHSKLNAEIIMVPLCSRPSWLVEGETSWQGGVISC